jgi:mannose/cellobiose epimerase-like protein (N-acyl-D-glucosamine 2-epimerase family)
MSIMVSDHIDTAWFRSILANETQHWLHAAATPSGFFRVNLDRAWRPVGKQIATLTSQNRQIYVLSIGWDLTGNTAYRDAVTKGTDFLLDHFQDTKYGGMFYSVSPGGDVIDDCKDTYGSAFALFGLSHAGRVTGETRYTDAALELWSDMKKNLRDSTGFYTARTTRDFRHRRRTTTRHPMIRLFQALLAGTTPDSSQHWRTNTQNPMMHLFEALLALYHTTKSSEVYQDAAELCTSLFTRLFQDRSGFLPELYDEAWTPLPVNRKGRIDIGHQFEWAYLLSHAVENGFSRKYLPIGERLLDYGMTVGYDRVHGGIFSTSDYEGHADRGPKSWWQQTELLRALMHYAVMRARPDLWEPFEQSLGFVKQHFIDEVHGGWYAYYDRGKPRIGTARNKGNLWQVGYHVCGMYVEALRLSRRLAKM